MRLQVIHTGNLMLDGGAMFGVVPKVLWQKVYPANEDNLINLSMRCLLVEENDRKVLIDTGIGNKQDEKFFRYYYLNGDDSLEKSLKNAGFNYKDITDVVLTHLHFDHCGGSVQKKMNGDGFTTAFPNARYWVGKEQWDEATNPNPREKASFLPENFLPIKEHGQLKLVEKDIELFPGFDLKLFHGHTHGQILPFIRYQDKTIVYVADLLPAAANIPLSWIAAYDIEPLVAMQEKQAFLQEGVANNYILFFEHDIYNECCTLKDTHKGVRVDRTFPLKEVL